MKTRYRIAAVVLALTMAAAGLVGCTNRQQDTVTLYETDALKIERQGTQTRIFDFVGNSTYTFTKHRTKAKQDAAQEAQTTAKTDSIEIKTVHGIIIVTTDAGTIYVK